MEPIFFDFESDTNGKIYFLAIRIDDHTIQYVCDQKLVGAFLRDSTTDRDDLRCF
jgi:hypothetical protein